ncbi:putative MFS-type transporter YkuC [Paenibacillus sp. J31TS4]|uniref:MFS transporter n=1 Tax=Paenibacillus sp. J31TS4 TaxID=2807195 RepID=UPI001B01908D|nr:MFS transporter [Paenibacillus sp. J31TS4]GIP40479.1 putative MFS-type transporter YkuC [Paenibacillus sp. J31TS4]
MQLFKNPAFTRLFLANFTSQLGTVVGTMAFAFYLLDRFSTRPFYATLAELMYALPALAVFLFTGVFADRLDRKKIAAYSDWIRAACTLLLIAAVSLDWIATAFVLLFLRSAVAKFFGPAQMGLLQGVLGTGQYVEAAGLNQMVGGLFMLFGMGLGSAAYHFLGIQGALLIDAASFVVSGLLIALCRFSPEVRQPNGPIRLRQLRLRAISADFGQGWVIIRRNALLLAIILGYFLFGAIDGVFAVLPLFTMKYKLSPDHYELYASLITVFLGIGFLIGSALASLLIKSTSKHAVLIGGLLLSGVLSIVLGLIGDMWLYLSIVLIVGVVIAPVNVVLGGWVPELVDPGSMGRVNAWMEPLLMLGQSLALGLIAVAYPAYLTIGLLYTLLGLCILAACLYYWLVLPSLVRRTAAAACAAVEG